MEGMRSTIANFRERQALLEENSCLRAEALSNRLEQLGEHVDARTEGPTPPVRHSEGPKPARLDNFAGD